jgi:hypothetical protein
MPAIHVIYDPQDRVSGLPVEDEKRLGISTMRLRIPEDCIMLRDVPKLGREIAELLLIQISFSG